MNPVGKVLETARKKNRKTIAQIARETRIKEKFLLALESGDYPSLPDLPISLGFAKSYAQTVGANPSLVAALLRRDFPQEEKGEKTRELPLSPPAFWTPRTTIFASFLVLVLGLAIYLLRQYLLFAGPPPVEVLGLKNDGDKVVLEGKTSPSATVEINGRSVLVEEDGSFLFQAPTDEVGSELSIRATSRTGKKSVVTTSP